MPVELGEAPGSGRKASHCSPPHAHTSTSPFFSLKGSPPRLPPAGAALAPRGGGPSPTHTHLAFHRFPTSFSWYVMGLQKSTPKRCGAPGARARRPGPGGGGAAGGGAGGGGGSGAGSSAPNE